MATVQRHVPDHQYFAQFTGDNLHISATGGNHALYLTGTGNTVVATGGAEMVIATAGHNSISTGAGDDVITLQGGGNVADAGGGNNTIYAGAGPGDKLVMPGAGHGFDSVYMTQGSDLSLDFRAALAGTDWDGSQATLGRYIHVATGASSTAISISATAGGAETAIASLSNIGVPHAPQWDAATVFAHALT